MVSNEDVVKFQKKITASSDYFYYQVMESLIVQSEDQITHIR